jgi:hypothetical protein
MNIPKDKLQHAAAGLLAALVSLALWVVAAHAGLVPLAGAPGAVVLGALVCGITKEGADYMANRVRPGSHGVELLDALATAAPGLVVGLAVQQVLLTAGA